MKIRLSTRWIIGAVSGHLLNMVLSIREILSLTPKRLYFGILSQKHKLKKGHSSETRQFMFYRNEKIKNIRIRGRNQLLMRPASCKYQMRTVISWQFSNSLTLRRPLCRKLRMRWLWPHWPSIRFLMRIFWFIPI